MNRREVNDLLGMMQVNYSSAFRGMNGREKRLLLDCWTFALQDLDAGIVLIACIKLLSTSKWLPTLAEIRDKARALYTEAAYMNLDAVPPAHRAAVAEALEAIRQKTQGLRGDGPAEITLESLLCNPRYAALAKGALTEGTDE